MRITRREILKAIRTENLKGGAFAHPKNDSSTYYGAYYAKNCKVCAVGAVLRQRGIRNEEIVDLASDLLSEALVDERLALEEKDYLAALSIKFEKLYKQNKGAGPKTIRSLVRFIKSNFPKQFNTIGKPS